MSNFITSIVTVCLNDGHNLERTLISVRKYKLPFQYYYVIDGGSEDNTKELIDKYSDVVDDYLVEHDRGLYDAMNKAVRLAPDQSYLIWVNAGDELLDWSQIDFSDAYKYDCLFFSVIQKDFPGESGSLVIPSLNYPFNERNLMPKSIFRHQGFLIKKEVFKVYMYSLDVGQQADGYLMSICQYKNICYVSGEPLVVFYLDGISNCRYWASLLSYFRIVDLFDFSVIKILYFQFEYIAKSFVKAFLSCRLIFAVRKIKEFFLRKSQL